MAEDSYAGYVKRPGPINWGEVASGIVTKMKGVEKEHEAFREKHDKMVSDMNKQFSEYQSTKAPAVDQTLFTLTDEGKGLLNNTHSRLKRKEIDPSYMGMTKQSMSDATTELHNITNNIGNVLSEAQTQVDEGDANPIMQQWAIDQYKDNTNLKNKKPVWVQDENNGYTSIVLQKTDGKGKLTPGPGTTTSIKQLGNMNNLRFLPIDLDADMKGFKNSFEVVRDDGLVTYRPITEEATDIFIKEYMSDSNRVLALLTMYGDHKPYAEGEGISSMDASKAIKMTVDDNYQYQPDFTEDQITAAKNILLERISRLGGKKEPIKSGSGGGSGGSTSTQPKLVYEYSTGLSQGDSTYIDLLINDTNNDITDVEITQAGPRKGVTIIKADGKREFIAYKYSGGEIDHDATGRSLAKYFSKKSDITDQQSEYDKGRDDFGKADPGGTTTRKRKPDITSITIKYDHPTVKNKKLAPANAIADSPEQFTKKVFKDLGVPGVKIVEINNADGSFKIEVEDKEFTIRKTERKDTGAKIKDANYGDVKKDIQKVIDWYWNKLAMEQPQEQQMDLTQTGAKYNVA